MTDGDRPVAVARQAGTPPLREGTRYDCSTLLRHMLVLMIVVMVVLVGVLVGVVAVLEYLGAKKQVKMVSRWRSGVGGEG